MEIVLPSLNILIMEREVIDIAANLITAYREPYYRESWMGGKPSAFSRPFTASANLIVFITAREDEWAGRTDLTLFCESESTRTDS